MNKFPNKFNMTKEQNIFVAKRNIVDYIYKSALLEGLNITFPETYAIYEQAVLQNISIDTVQVVLNLKHAWKKLLNTLDDELNLTYIKNIHAEVARGEAIAWGELRTGKVGISGTDYIPPIPNEKQSNTEIEKLLLIKQPTERAIEIMLWGMKSQLFWDGNKRTSMMIANKIMIQNGCGVISVSPKYIKEFNGYLSDYYTNNTIENIKQFVYDNCIDGIEFEKEKTKKESFVLKDKGIWR